MKTAQERIQKTARITSKWLEEAKLRQDNKAWTKQSFRIAVRILREIRNQKESNRMTQKKLAEAMEVSPQYINKVVKGKENLTLETICKIEQILGIKLIEVPFDKSSMAIKMTEFASYSIVKRTNAKLITSESWEYNHSDLSYATGTNG